jgi:hypothetical protein
VIDMNTVLSDEKEKGFLELAGCQDIGATGS